MTTAIATPDAIAREKARVNTFPPAPPPPWANDPVRAASVMECLVELDIAGGFIKPDPLLDGGLLAAPDFYTERRREGIWPEPIRPEVVL